MKTKSQLRKEIREAKRAMGAAAYGSPEHTAAVAHYWALQGELGKIELQEAGL